MCGCGLRIENWAAGASAGGVGGRTGRDDLEPGFHVRWCGACCHGAGSSAMLVSVIAVRMAEGWCVGLGVAGLAEGG